MPRYTSLPFPLPVALLFFLHLAHAATVTPANPQRDHVVTLSFTGPQTSETADPNPFFQYRLDVSLTHVTSQTTRRVPGYYAADGNSAQTGAKSGRIWVAHFSPPRTGTWLFVASFREGKSAAASLLGGRPVFFDGDSGRFNVSESTAAAPDLRARGRLQYVGQRYLRFARGGYQLKLGTNTPENFLAYPGFDADEKLPTQFEIGYKPHRSDWEEGDPTWGDSKRGKEIIGAVNYLASQRVNSLFAIIMTERGDSGGSSHPWIKRTITDRYDVSKLAQWEIVFAHATQKGMALNLAFCETENEAIFEYDANLSTSTGFADSRKVYYREMVARFSHHPGFTLTLGEENGWDEKVQNGGGFPWGKGNTDRQRRLFTQYIRDVDPYDSPIGVHTFPSMKTVVYTPMLGPESGMRVENANLQLSRKASTYNSTREWISASVEAGLPWIVTVDEIGSDMPGDPAGVPLVGDGELNVTFRATFAWANFLAGGAGIEVFSGSVDQRLDDFRKLERAWQEFARPIRLFTELDIPFWAMEDARDDVSLDKGLSIGPEGPFVYALAIIGDIYVIYRSGGTDVFLDLTEHTGRFFVTWFNPRAVDDAMLEGGDKGSIRAGKKRVNLGMPPRDTKLDWVVVVSREVPGPRRKWLTQASARDFIPGAVTMGVGSSRIVSQTTLSAGRVSVH